MQRELPLRNRVRELRARLGLRQADLAEQADVTRQTIIAIEKGRLNPSIVLCLKISRILREPVEYVFYLTSSDAQGEEVAESNIAELPRRVRVAAPVAKEEPVVAVAAVVNEVEPPKPALAKAASAEKDGERPQQAIWDFFQPE